MMKKKTMEGDRPESHRSGGRCGSAFFICFTARSSASSAAAAATMRVPSCKSLRSPGRGRDPAAPSLSASLSKRLRNSRSLKGGQSPMFPAVGTAAGSGGGGRRKGCVLEAAEPSSPKVTCIGQVRVRSKKKKKAKAKAAAAAAMAMARSRSKRVSGSFRRTEEECLPRKNQSWVYQLPVSICEALRAFGSEFNCFLPCGNSPCSSSRTEEGKRRECEEKRTTSSCGQVLARWLMAMPEGEEGKRGEVARLMGEERGKREMDLVIGDTDKREMEGVEVGVGNGNEAEKKDEVLVVGDEGAAAVCIPPRNALLLMRCRSDPVRMAALANQFWGSPATKVEVEEEEDEEGEEGDVEVGQHLFGLVEVDREKVRAGRDEEAVAAAKARPETGKPGKEAAEEEKSSQGVMFHAALEERESSAEKKQQKSSEEKQDENENRGESLKERSSAHCAEVKRNLPREEVENNQLLEKSEEMAVKEETDLLDREEGKEGEEEKGRRSSNCSSSMGKEERRSHNHKCLSKAKEGGRRLSSSSRNKEKRRHSFSTERDARKHGFSNEREDRRASFSIEGKKRWSFSIDKEDLIPEEENAVHEEEEKKKEEDSSVEGEESRETEAVEKPKEAEEEEIEVNGGGGSKEKENGRGEEEVKGDEEEKRGELPDCLLLMMYEPKVSMEVSKETWVCSTDFLRRLPHHRRQLPQGSGGGGGGGGGGGERAKTERVGGSENKEVKAPAEPAALQVAPPPPPPAPPTASAIEQKLMSAAAEQAGPAASAYGPFVLTRCKSEPMRTSARLAPDACFWKDGRRPIGAAGIGF